MVLHTGAGVWNPVFWLGAMALSMAVAVFFVAGSTTGKRSTGDKGMPFLSGNAEVTKEHLKASNIYWGFLEALKGYYKVLADMHTGLVSDYVFWYLTALAAALVVVLI